MGAATPFPIGETLDPSVGGGLGAGWRQRIAEVAVLGLPDEKWGEAVTAVVALHEGESLTLDELRAFAEPFLAKYKLPLRLHLVDALPRNPAGKVLKFVLKEELAG